MSWLFSRALVEEYSAANSLDGEPWSQLNVMPTPHKFWRNDKTMESSDLSQFGLTLRLLTEGHGMAVLTSFLAAFPARTSAPPAKAPDSMANEAASGSTWRASFARYSPEASTWKTPQFSLLGGLVEFSETWPRWGLMQNGESYLRPTPVLPICESASGLWPTPTASEGSGGGKAEYARLALDGVPRASGAQRALKLRDLVMLRPGPNSQSGQLNPNWVEWLMGWPIGWTDLKPLETAKFQEWQKLHGKYSPLLNSRPPDPGGNLPSE
jgi:hypothetical protein